MPHADRRVTPCVEGLETRTLFAHAFAVSFLKVAGNANAANVINVTNSSDGQSIDVNVVSTNKAGAVRTFQKSFAKSLGFNVIRISGGRRDDVVNVGTADDPITIDTRIRTFAGNDTVTGGAGNDVIALGAGDDTAHAGLGNDVIRSGKGNDHAFGEDSDDKVWGGFGDDEVDGGNGNDKLGGILDTNKMRGGPGADEFVVRSLEQNPDNDYSQTEDTLTIVTKPQDETSDSLTP